MSNLNPRVEAMNNAQFDKIEEEVLNGPALAPYAKKVPIKTKTKKQTFKNHVPGEPNNELPDWCYETVERNNIRLLETKEKADAEAQRLYDYTIKHHEENILQDKVIPTEIKPR